MEIFMDRLKQDDKIKCESRILQKDKNKAKYKKTGKWNKTRNGCKGALNADWKICCETNFNNGKHDTTLHPKCGAVGGVKWRGKHNRS
jgi:hypothetical protein